MARIRKIEIENFRSIKKFSWMPSNGLNCLIGPGDSGKSTILDAIDWCLGARRNLNITDADFYQLNVKESIRITLVIGDLHDDFKKLDSYDFYLQGFDSSTGQIEDEPKQGIETVLKLRLSVKDDLEPQWSLISKRAEAQDKSRNISWADRIKIAPLRIGEQAQTNFSWMKGSLMSRLSEKKPDAEATISNAIREAKSKFSVTQDMTTTLDTVKDIANKLGIPVGEEVKILLDAIAISVRGGAISLHDESGVPLRSLGTGSSRLLLSGLQRHLSTEASIVLIDELEHGLEPHRVIRLIDSLGAKDSDEPIQGFFVTHSPVALREFSGNQLHVLRKKDEQHEIKLVGEDNDTQGAIRSFPEAFLAKSVIICEGATEVGFLRGLDQFWQSQDILSKSAQSHHQSCVRYKSRSQDYVPMAAQGVALVNVGGGGPEDPYKKAEIFQGLGYRTAILQDNDQKINPCDNERFGKNEGTLFTWSMCNDIEKEIFASLSNSAVCKLVKYAISIHGEDKIKGCIRFQNLNDSLIKNNDETRSILGESSNKNSWFKTIYYMEYVAKNIIGPDMSNSSEDFVAKLNNIRDWITSD